ncbi:YqaE/Pmp3 family membrane protein [Catalinimonas niigatensis]|uniref:YqaE/Pmp3 family membrane protein n=1 Tax=Catalinimonas niigatensis TaxID=1397264 RepID=UPI0026660CF3|nr:YqaE/Pmp3 family membrane protein [Catalinimonas niigatensis]WPP52051.1 YqaE/Pmp3 family membrane protein [Catalinimonas niigatensis]
MTLLSIILAIFLPPLGVALKYGLSGKFWINLLLTLIGWIPGVIHAFIVLSRSR